MIYHHEKNGFTLIELTLVLLLLSVLVAVQLPRMHQRQEKTAMIFEAETLRRAMDLASLKARMEKREVRARLDEEEQRVYFEEMYDPVNRPGDFMQVDHGPLGRPVILSVQAKALGADEMQLLWRFMPDGDIQGGGVLLEDKTGRRARIPEAEKDDEEEDV